MRYIKLLVRKTVLPFIHYGGIGRLITRFSVPKYLILNYHGVVKKVQPEISRNHLSVQQFQKHLDYFSKHFDVISLQLMIERHRQGIRPLRPTIAITFDDGYENNYSNAYPLLLKHNFPATIFVTAQALTKPDEALWYDTLDICKDELNWDELLRSDKAKLFQPIVPQKPGFSFDHFKQQMKNLDEEKKAEVLRVLLPINIRRKKLDNADREYWKLLNATQLHEMASSALVEIGSHGLTHTNLDSLNEEGMQTELKSSKELLEKASSKSVISIAYPDGAYNSAVKLQSKKTPYKNLLAVNFRLSDDGADKDIFERFSISNTTTFESVMIQIHLAFTKIGF